MTQYPLSGSEVQKWSVTPGENEQKTKRISSDLCGFRSRWDSLLGNEDVGPHLVHGVGGGLQPLLHHGPLDVQHTRRVVGAAVVNHVAHAVVQVLNHQLLCALQHGLRDGLGTHAAGWQLFFFSFFFEKKRDNKM